MACHYNENVYTTVFTPREYQVELLDTSKESNTIVCLGNNNAKTFVALKLVQELALEVRRCAGIKSVFILDAQNVDIMSSHIRNLTDLTVGQFESLDEITKLADESWKTEFKSYQVLVMTSDTCLLCIKYGYLMLKDVNLLVIDDCRLALNQNSLRQISEEYSALPDENRPRILGLTTTVLCQHFDPARLQAEFEFMEKILHCTVDTSSDIVTVLRYCSKPSEKVVLCANAVSCQLSEKLEFCVENVKKFLSDHRYDPFEIYDDEFREELQEVPDPKIEPLAILDEFLFVLRTMGPWCADRAAFALLIKIENLKVKTPYERHYLLLCVVSTVMVNIRAICDNEFQSYNSDHECIYKYSTPRILRLLQVLRTFKPESPKNAITEVNKNDENLTTTSENLQIITNQVDINLIDSTDLENTKLTSNADSNSETESAELNKFPFSLNQNSNSLYCFLEKDPKSTKNILHLSENSLQPKITNEAIPESEIILEENEIETCVENGKSETTSSDSSHVLTEEIKESNNVSEETSNSLLESSSEELHLDKISDKIVNNQETKPNVLIENTSASKLDLEASEFSLKEEILKSKVSDTIPNSSEVKNIAIAENKIPSIIINDASSKISISEYSSKEQSQPVKVTDTTVDIYRPLLFHPVIEVDVIKNGCDSSEISKSKDEPNYNSVIAQNFGMRGIKGRTMRGNRKGQNPRIRPNYAADPDALCAIIFVEKRFTAKILYYLINELCHSLEEFNFLSVQYTVEKIADPITESREAENEHRKQEEVLKKFRSHECNLLIATKVLEEGIEIPKCNLVIRFDQPLTYNSYVQCKGRAKMPDAHYVLMSEESNKTNLISQLSEYSEIEKMLLKKCKNREPSELEEREADLYTNAIEAYTPNNGTGASVTVATAVALVNKYCAKLPSDTFTRLTPLWWINNKETNGITMYQCSIRLPINSPLKQTITGSPMPSKVLARRITALEVCRLLHKMGELDDNLLPVGKESFKAFEDDWNNFPLEESDELLAKSNLDPRPGTTKRRQYYYKRVADALTICRPLASIPAYLYLITMNLTCPLPEEQNTRGRKIYPPEDSAQGFGILTLKQIPKICPFPIFTRSGEVRVGLELASPNVIMSQEQLDKVMEFLNYIFTNVLRLQKYLMLFDPNASENSYFIVPTIADKLGETKVDWNFLNEIYDNRNLVPRIIPEENRKDFAFDSEMYQDAVVMPWYRNQDQPQYFYVAEICNHLNPKSSFPGTDYKTFEEYYFKKYNIQIQNLDQPLLDVDHTSARLNFLTPRYVNRKGVALPTSSEETKRAKRENLEQKQILVPELCTVHPFPASLWRKAVCLPCILYRINALLLADQIRKKVAEELALGQIELDPDFEWTPLNFGWSLSDVLKKSKEKCAEKLLEKSPEHKNVIIKEGVEENLDEVKKENEITENSEKNENEDNSGSETEQEEEKDWMEIGTWSNEMASSCKLNSLNPDGLDSLIDDLPQNITMCYGRENSWNADKLGIIRYGSPTSWMQSPAFDDYDSDDSCESYSSDRESTDNSNKSGGLRIEFKSDNVAEAIDIESGCQNRELMLLNSEFTECFDDDFEDSVKQHLVQFKNDVKNNEEHIMTSGVIIPSDQDFKIEKKTDESRTANEKYEVLIKSSLQLPTFNLKNHQNHNQLKVESVDKSSSNFVDINTKYEYEYEKIDFKFSFDYQPDLKNHPGPSPSVILQALTMSNANDGINLERLETIGDSYLKYAITNYLYSTYDNIHEGKLSHLRSKQVSNLNLYRLGRLKVLGESMIATKFDPHDNWLPPCYYVPKEFEQALIDARVPASHWNRADLNKDMSKEEIYQMVREKSERLGLTGNKIENGCENDVKIPEVFNLETLPCFIPYNLITQHSIPDKSVADCVEALIGAYLIECGPRGALLFMAWLGIRVLPKQESIIKEPSSQRVTGSLPLEETENGYRQVLYGELSCPRSPLLHHIPNAEEELEKLLNGFDEFERSIQYHFNDRSYLLQAMTHASYSPNTITDCYQRLEFLGDAVLDYLITRHLYEDPRLHSPGALTDLRSALVNNTIFASLAVRHGFHKYFRHLSPGLHDVVNRFVQIQEENGHSISEEYYLITEDESEEIEDVEVPKALGDVFESVAGAIFLDSGMSLDAVWRVYYRMMHKEIEQFSTSVPKSPIRELLELEPETAKFGKPEKLADGRRVRVTVEVFGKGIFKGIGRNYRIAKCTAAKCALKQLKKRGLLMRKS